MEPDQAGSPPGMDIMAALKKAGVPQTVKGKVQRAIFRMIAGGMGLEYFQKVRENLDTIEGRSRINLMVAEEIGKQAIADPEFMERAKARFLGEMAFKQENIEAVARIAQAQSAADPEANSETTDDQPEPSQDWMNTFIRAAEDASSDELRDRLARVLAGEAKRPGTFSRSTVRFIAEADKEVLEEFQRALQYRAGDAIYRGNDWEKGEWFSRGVLLESTGLITGSSGFTKRLVRIDKNGHGFVFGDKLALTVNGSADIEKQVSIFLVTRVGLEVAALLPATNEMSALQRVGTLIEKHGLTKMWIGPYSRTPTGFNVHQSFLVWDAEAQSADAGT